MENNIEFKGIALRRMCEDDFFSKTIFLAMSNSVCNKYPLQMFCFAIEQNEGIGVRVMDAGVSVGVGVGVRVESIYSSESILFTNELFKE
jgi:hypothetical protein